MDKNEVMDILRIEVDESDDLVSEMLEDVESLKDDIYDMQLSIAFVNGSRSFASELLDAMEEDDDN